MSDRTRQLEIQAGRTGLMSDKARWLGELLRTGEFDRELDAALDQLPIDMVLKIMERIQARVKNTSRWLSLSEEFMLGPGETRRVAIYIPRNEGPLKSFYCQNLTVAAEGTVRLTLRDGTAGTTLIDRHMVDVPVLRPDRSERRLFAQAGSMRVDIPLVHVFRPVSVIEVEVENFCSQDSVEGQITLAGLLVEDQESSPNGLTHYLNHQSGLHDRIYPHPDCEPCRLAWAQQSSGTETQA